MGRAAAYTKDLETVKKFLKSNGWSVMRSPENNSEDFYAQGVVYMNFCKDGLGIHLEFGSEDCVFDEGNE